MPLFLLALIAALAAQPLPRLAHAGFTPSLDNGSLSIAQIRPGSIAGLQPADVFLTPTPDSAYIRSILRRNPAPRFGSSTLSPAPVTKQSRSKRLTGPARVKYVG